VRLQTSYICNTPELSERNGLETNLTPPSGGIQQAGAPETAEKSVTPCFYLPLVIASS